MKIDTLTFDKNAPLVVRNLKKGEKWPVVYIINNTDEAYVGETTNAYLRTNQHLANEVRRKLNKLHIISDDEFNKSAVLDIESYLIKYMAGDGKFKLQNGNNGLQFHYYYQKEKYENKFKSLWIELRKKGLVKQELKEIENTDLFKYSPYKSLSTDQYMVVNNILDDLANFVSKKEGASFVVNGEAGTGKTVLGIYLIKLLMEVQSGALIIEENDVEESLNEIMKLKDSIEPLKIGLVIPMASLRATLKKVFKDIKGLKPSMVLSPTDVVKGNYDLLIVDEAHRLRRRKNLTQYKSFDDNNKLLKLGKDGTELDWIIKNSKYQIMFYDSDQSIKPTDIRGELLEKLMINNNHKIYDLSSQLRSLGGKDYINYVKSIFSLKPPKSRIVFKSYDLKLFNNIDEMINAIKMKDAEYGLSRVVAGYSWKWNTKDKKDLMEATDSSYDIVIDNKKYIWNTQMVDWPNSKNAINEIGCIHTVQGYDLNYVGVILGEEITYDIAKRKIVIDKRKYYDAKGKAGITNDKELYEYIINIYTTLMVRGIKGTYVYVCDENLRKYLANYF